MKPIEKLIKELSRLPGIGEKTATRLAYHITKWNTDDAKRLSSAITDVKEKIRFCPTCFNLAEGELCSICSNKERDHSIICVVEDPQDAQSIERTGTYNGVYHILHGSISPLDGIGPDNLRIHELMERLKLGSTKELILATNPTITGEATALYLSNIIKPFGVKLTRIAFGIPFGGDIEYIDKSTLARSLESRSSI